MPRPAAGEVWYVDFGYKGKIRPCLVVSKAAGEKDRDLYTVVPHTTSVTGSIYEVEHSNSVLKAGGKNGVFNVQGVITVGPSDFGTRLTTLNATDYDKVLDALYVWLDFEE